MIAAYKTGLARSALWAVALTMLHVPGAEAQAWQHSSALEVQLDETAPHPKQQQLRIVVPTARPKGSRVCLLYFHGVFEAADQGKVRLDAVIKRPNSEDGRLEHIQTLKLGQRKVKGTGINVCRPFSAPLEEGDVVTFRFKFQGLPQLVYPYPANYSLGQYWQ